MARAPLNSALVKGVARLPRHKVYKLRHLYKRPKNATVAPADVKATTKTKEVKGDKNGGKRVVPVQKAPRFYPAEDVPKPLACRKVARSAKLRSSITPGTVLVVLSGKFRGKRVVFLKQLASGLLLVTGPFKVNGVPLRRINQAYVIATSAKVDLSGVNVDEKFNDAYFKRPAPAKGEKSERDFTKRFTEKKAIAESRVADQKAVDSSILAAVKKTPMLRQYLKAPFTLTKGQFPHAIKF